MIREIVLEKLKEAASIAAEDDSDVEALLGAIHWIIRDGHEEKFLKEHVYPYCVNIYAAIKLNADMLPINNQAKRFREIEKQLKDIIKNV